jgi:hypothetical protein
MQATKYGDLVVVLILLDEVELRSKELAEQFPELRDDTGCIRCSRSLRYGDNVRSDTELTFDRSLLLWR